MTNLSSVNNQPEKRSFKLNPFPTVNLSWRLGLGFGVLVGLTLLVVILSFIAGREVTTHINLTSELRVPSVLSTTRAQASLLEMVNSVRGYLVLGNRQDIDNYNRAKEEFEVNLAEIEDLLRHSNDQENQQRLATLRTVFETWVALPEQLFELHNNPRKNQPAFNLYRTKVYPLSVPLFVDVDALIQLQNRRQASVENFDLLNTLVNFQNSFEVMMTNLQAHASTGDLSFKSGYTTRLPINFAAWETLQKNRNALTPEQQAKLEAIALAREQILKLAPRIFEAVEGERAYEDLYLFRTEAVPQAEQMLQLLNTVTLEQQTLLQSDLNQSKQSLSLAQTQVLTGGFAAVILGVALAFIFRRGIINPVRRLTNVAEQIRGGNLNAQARVESKDEIGVLAGTFNDMTAQLRQTLEDLERGQQDLNRQNQYLGILAVLSERLSAILDLETLLAEVVNQVKERFDYYHTHIYLVDENNEYLVMAVGAGWAGAQMKAAGHKILLNTPHSLVARAARTQEIVRVDNVREAEDWLPNPLLPDTYSEMAVPIILDGQTAGVLDVQENEVAGLDEDDADLLRLLANQAAVAIRNARLFTQIEVALTEARLAQEKYIEQSWQSDHKKQHTEYLHTRSIAATPLATAVVAEARRLGQMHAQPAIVTIDSNQPHSNTLVAPVRLSGKTIGVLHVHPPDGDSGISPWSEQDLELVETILDQVAQTAENLRLFDETRQRATQEKNIREVTDKLRAAPNLDLLLKTAARELGHRLGVEHTVLELGIEAGQTSPARSQNDQN
jgi:GAF domain-containing protein/CHASE3 domain sensor protein